MNLRYYILTVLTLVLFSGFLAGEERIYLSGMGPSDAVNWEFKISTGRHSGFWTKIPVPSNWEQHGFGYYTYGNDHENYQADPEIGFYRRTFSLNRLEGKRYRLVFQGVMTDTHVKVNGKLAGEVHRGGFMQFSYEITGLIKEGENLLEVEVHKSSEDINIQQAERITDFWLFGGIYRPVYIAILPGEFIDRLAIDARVDGSFTMDTYLDTGSQKRYLRATIKDSAGKKVGRTIERTFSGNSPIRLTHQFDNIRPWSHEFPNLYEVEVCLLDGNGKDVIHLHSQKFGFRTFEVRDHDGFYLNGKRILLKGAALHSFRPRSGRTLSRSDIKDSFQIMRDLNFNTVRACHYPPDEYLLELCDSLGLLVIDELTGWHHPLNKENGSRLVKELISRDVNHPSVILWSNGNHYAHNPELDEDFYRWDIQQRRPLKNAAKSEVWPGIYSPDFDVIDTRYYPNYDQLTDRLKDTHIVFPNESLHALYDGGGAAGLSDYWEAIKASEVGGGMMIWALMDEGLYNTDLNRIDVQVNKAPDGLVGPHGEKEGSYYAVKEIWSPVQIEMKELPVNFTGEIEVKNDFSFVDLEHCCFHWQLINFKGPHEAGYGFRTKADGKAKVKSIPVGEKGKIQLLLPDNWRENDAIRLEVRDHRKQHLFTRVWPIKARSEIVDNLTFPQVGEIKQKGTNKYEFTLGNNSLKFDEKTGVLKELSIKGERLSVNNAPFVVAKPEEGLMQKSEIKTVKRRVTLQKTSRGFEIESFGNAGFDWFKWEIFSNGTIQLSYEYSLIAGRYYYAGVGMETEAARISGKRWLGEGPSRVWKNRMRGGVLNVWDIEKHENIPGKVWNVPEFEGCFSPWYWAEIRFTGRQKLLVSTKEENLLLGILNPVNGEDPKHAIWRYPEEEGIFLFNCISAVGGKWKEAKEYGPASQTTEISSPCRGSFQIHLPVSDRKSQIINKTKEIE